jgi:hypothetical protein
MAGLVPQEDLPRSLSGNVVPDSDLPSFGSSKPSVRPEDVGIGTGTAEAFKRGLESFGDIYQGYKLAGAKLTGTDEEAARQMAAIKAEQAKPVEKPALRFADLERIYKEQGLGSALKEVPKYIAESAAESAPQMAVPLAAGAAAGAVSGPFAPIVAPVVGIGAYGLQQFGSLMGRQAQEKENPQDISVGKAATAAAIQAPIGYFADRFTLGIGGLGEKGVLEVGKELAKRKAAGEITAVGVGAGVAKQAGKGAAVGFIAEAPTEALEQVLERWQAGLDLASPDAYQEYKEAFFGAGGVGLVGGAASRGRTAYKGLTTPEEIVQAAPAAPKEQGQLLLPAPDEIVLNEKEYDPLKNPLGNFGWQELTKEQRNYINKDRKENGKPRLNTYSLEDVVDAIRHTENTPEAQQGAIDTLLQYKTSYDAVNNEPVSADDVLRKADLHGVDTTTKGWTDYLNRVSGSEDIASMNPPQLYSAFKALDQLPVNPAERIILPEGTNAVRFNEAQYAKALKGLEFEFGDFGTNSLSRTSVIQSLKDFSGLQRDVDAEALYKQALKRGDLEENMVERKTTEGVKYPVEVSFAGKSEALPGGFDIRDQAFKHRAEPESYDIRNGAAFIKNVSTADQAQIELDKQTKINEKLAQQEQKKIDQLLKNIANRDSQLDVQRAKGFANTLGFKKLEAYLDSLNKVDQKSIETHTNDIKNLSNPLQIVPVGEKPVTKRKQVFYKEGKPTASFEKRVEAEAYGILNLDNATLEQIVASAPTTKGTLPKRYAAMAKKELERRRSDQKGIEVPRTTAYTEEVQKKADDLAKVLLPTLKRFGLEKVGLRIVDSIKNNSEGLYEKQLITVALNADNPMGVLRHESIHALKDLGAFTPQEWKVLENKAKSEWIDKYIKKTGLYKAYEDAYKKQNNGNLNGFNEYIQEEAIAEAFADFANSQPPAGLVGNLYARLNEFFKALRNALQRLGFTTEDRIFREIEAGEKAIQTASTLQGAKMAIAPRKIGDRIVGSPPDAKTEEDRKALVKRMVKLLEHPYSMYDRSKDWYERSGATIREIARDDPALMEQVVRLTALYSQANSLGGNITAVIKSVAQIARGEKDILAGRFPETTAKVIPAILAAPTMDTSLKGVDDKLMNFYRNLHDATFETDTFQDSSTIDRWMMRLFGYPHTDDQDVGGANSVSTTQYIYAKDLVERITAAQSKKTGEELKPRQIQAVLWTYIKNQSEYEKAVEKAKDLAIKNGEVFNESAVEFTPDTLDFSDYVKRATAHITWESRPSTSIPMIEGIHTAPREEQEAFNRAVRNMLTDTNGEDKIFKLLGDEQLYSSQLSIGGYENKIAPNIITKVVLQKDETGHLVQVARDYASIIGFITRQDAVPWYRPDPTASGKLASKGYKVSLNVPVTQELEEKLFKHLDEAIPGIGFTKVDDTFDFINYRGTDGKPYMMSDKKYIDALQNALQTFSSDVNFNIDEFRAQSEYLDNDWKENTNGEGHLARISPERLPNIRATINSWRNEYDEIAKQFGEEFGWTRETTKPDQPTIRPSEGSGGGITLGTQQEGAITVEGVHYGAVKTDELDASKFGTGLRGAERRRLEDAYDDRIKNRIYFYIPKETGEMPARESGVGSNVYTQKFNNILGQGKEMSRLYSEAMGDANNFESAIIDAGYDGYAVPSMGMMVVLNHNVPVNYEGTVAELTESGRLKEGKVSPKMKIRAPESTAFKQWFGDSKIVNPDGTPKVMYHGTARDITTFKPKQAEAIFLTDNPDFAQNFSNFSENRMVKEIADAMDSKPDEKRALITKLVNDAIKDKRLGTNKNSRGLIKTTKEEHIENFMNRDLRSAIDTVGIGDELFQELRKQLPSNENIMPLFVKAENPFDYLNASHVNKLVKEMNENFDDYGRKIGTKAKPYIERGSWESIENGDVQEALKSLGFDGFYVVEGGVRNLAVYSPNQVKSATGNTGEYNPENPDIRYSIKKPLNIDPAITARINATTPKRVEKGFVERLMDAISPDSMAKIRQALVNKYEGIERLSKAVAEKYGNDQLLAETSAIASALQSDRAAGVASASFTNGIPVYKNGYFTIEPNTKGLIAILEPLMSYGNPEIFQAFQFYAATRRGKRLLAEGREQLFTADDIKMGKDLEAQFPMFKQVFDEYQVYNKGLVDLMVGRGVISKKEGEIWTQNWDYIPFYRQMDGEKTAGPRVFSSLVGVAKPKELQGGKTELADFMETVVRNARAAIEASMKNEAAQRVVRDAVRMELAREVPLGTTGKDVVTVKKDGVNKYYQVDDMLLVEAMKGLNLPQMEWLSWLAAPANLLRNFVTKDPGFMIANLGRDSLQAWITSGTDMKPVVDTFKQFTKTLTNSSPEAQALAMAGLTGYDFSGDVRSTAKEVEKELRKRGGARTTTEKVLSPLTSFWDMLEHGSHASDMATRAEVYKRTLERTGSEAEAFYQAMEVLNFSRKGNSDVIRIVSALVPFFNARVQGLDVLYRSGWGKFASENADQMKKAFASRALTMMGLSMAYWFLVSDDEEYKKLSKEERDNYWIIPAFEVNGKPFRFPIPFELGVVFKVLPERVLETAFGNDTGKDLKESFVRNMTNTLQINPIPQAFIPIVENIVNYSFFTGDPIVGRGMEDLAPQYQFTQGTSQMAKDFGAATGMSPIKVENFVRGYTGTMGTYAVQLLDAIYRSEGDPVKATSRLEQFPVIKRFFSGDSGTVSAYYDLKQDVNEVVRTVNMLERTGNIDGLREYIAENGKLYNMRGYITALEKDMKQIREYRNYINSSKEYTAEEKRERLDTLHDLEIRLTLNIKDIRKEYTSK